jgi:dolichol-phosphate mannosyltransferase
MKNIGIILPVLNEEKNILVLTKRIKAALSNNNYVVQFIDDGSSDATVKIIKYLDNKYLNYNLLQRKKLSHGSIRGSALYDAMKSLYKNPEIEVFIEMDGDLSHRPEELTAGITIIKNQQADVVIASKFVGGGRIIGRTFLRNLISFISSKILSFIFKRSIKDYSNGYRFYNRAAAKLILDHTIHYSSPIYLTEVLAIWLKNKLIIKEFASTYHGRMEGLSKLRFIDLFKAFFAVFEIAIRYYVIGFRKKKHRE